MYCGACARDIALVRGLIKRGHDVQIIPLYTPLKIEGDEPANIAPVYLGGINAYLQQKSALFRHLPPLLDRALDNPRLLRWVSRFAISTEAAKLGAMTVSVLAGRDGKQRKEVARLVAYLKTQPAPDVFVITNALLSGLAPELERRFAIPVLCGLQGEDSFVQSMPEPHRSRAQELMQANVRSADLLIAPGDDYARRMTDYLAVPAGKVRVVRTGLDLADYAAVAAERATAPPAPFTVGHLSVITPGKGLDLLVEAARILVRDQGRDVRLLVAGLVLDQGYWRQVQQAVADAGLTERFEYRGEVDYAGKLQLLREATVFAAPGRFYEARGVAVMEAIAAGVPVVVPEHGAYPEIRALTGGGLTYPLGSAPDLATRLAELMDDPAEATRLGQTGSAAMATHFSADVAAEAMLAVLGEVTGA